MEVVKGKKRKKILQLENEHIYGNENDDVQVNALNVELQEHIQWTSQTFTLPFVFMTSRL